MNKISVIEVNVLLVDLSVFFNVWFQKMFYFCCLGNTGLYL